MPKFQPFLAFLAIGLISCARQPSVVLTDAGPATLPQGWTLATNDKYGVSIGVAPGWKHGVDTLLGGLDLSTGGGTGNPTEKMPPVDPQLQKMADDMKRQSIEQEKADLQKLEDDGIIVNVIDLGSRQIIGEARTRYYVHLKKDNGPTVADAVADLKKSLIGDVTQTTAKLPVGDAAVLKAHWKNQGGDEYYTINYVLVDGDNVYRIKFIEVGNSSTIDSVADQVAQSFRVVRKS